MQNKGIFRIDDLKDESILILYPCYSIVIDSINSIYVQSFQITKYFQKDEDLTVNTEKSEKSIELEKNFNNYLWIFREDFSLHNCRIKNKILISSLMKINKEDAEILKTAANDLKNINDSILITLKDQNALHYDSAILKYISDKDSVKYYELYLFQTIKKESNERLSTITLNIEKIYLKFLFYLNSVINIENVFFFIYLIKIYLMKQQ